MTRRVLAGATLFGLVAFTASGAFAWEPGKVAKDKFAFGGQAVTYYVYVPKAVTAPAPLVLLLHGSGRNGKTMIDEWKKIADKEALVIVAPDAQDRQGWFIPTDGPALSCALLMDLQKTLPVNPRRTYLFGHSAGAVFGLYLAVLESQFFAAAAVHAGAWRSADELQAAAYAERKIPIALYVGDQDPLFPVEAVKATAAALKKEQVPVEVEVISNHNHNYYMISGRVNASAWSFMKTCELEADPRYSQHTFGR